ncbi:hypothetical protein [Faecalicatena contorta]|uniref:hypothetical protein n=1 Tax=Faecalicatena contorta TaxID=39482 RepID=UPI001F24845C|nr:hypothetical protein [Faecalicatena contorta]MCF2555567.1 hypothetical protein [Faecalicatena contorta]
MLGQIELEDYLKSIQKQGFDILDYIPTGSKNAITRKRLSQITGISDRAIRDLIHYARRDIPILNMQDGKGYFIPDMNDETEVKLLRAYYNQENARLKSIGWSLLSARKALKEHDIQINDTRKTG